MPQKATRPISSAVKDAEELAAEILALSPGCTESLELRVAQLPTGSWATMPVSIIRGVAGGPVIWLSSALHGDELNGVEIVRQLLTRIDPLALRGTVIAVPIVNVFGFTTNSRYLPDGRDLNRSFPGSERGSLAGRTAHLFYQYIVKPCKLGIDFHTGSGGRCNLPQLRCDLNDPKIVRLAHAFGSPLAIHSNLRDGSLRAAAQRDDIGVLLYEAGEAGRFDQQAIRMGVEGTLRVMKAMKMLKEAPPRPKPEQVLSRSSMWTRTGRSGFCHLRVELGQRVQRGETIALISDSASPAESQVRARTEGIVIGVLRAALVHRGDAVVHIAELEA